MSDYEEIDEESSPHSLSEQLGSSGIHLGRGQIDLRILTIINDSMDTPDTFKSMLYWTTYNDVVNNGKDFASAVIDNLLALNISIRGRGRRDLLKAEQVRQGIGVNTSEDIKKPGWVERNLTNRQWEKREKEALGIE